MSNISGYGFQIVVQASVTLPVGYVVTSFADDADPFDVETLQIADKAMGLNGDLIVWSKANPINISFNLIPGTEDDIVMSALLEANRVGRGKVGARDVITMTGVYPDGRVIILNNGIITDGMPGNSVSSEGRQKSKPFSFSFENKVGV